MPERLSKYQVQCASSLSFHCLLLQYGHSMTWPCLAKLADRGAARASLCVIP
jgi:hypothetical protein